MTDDLPAVPAPDDRRPPAHEAHAVSAPMWQLVRDRLGSTSQAGVDMVISQVLSAETPPDVETIRRDLINIAQVKHEQDVWEDLLADPETLDEVALTLRAMALVERSSLGALTPQRLRDQVDNAVIADTLARMRRPALTTPSMSACAVPAETSPPAQPSSAARLNGEYSTVVFTDIVGFPRDDEDRALVRRGMYDALREAFEQSSIPWDDCYREDRGDGALIVVPSRVPIHQVIDPMLMPLAESVQRHNLQTSPTARFRLRVAVHAGPVYVDAHGLISDAIIHTARLLDCPTLKQRLAATQAEVGFIVSDSVHNRVIARGSEPETPRRYQQVKSMVKESEITGWMYLATGAGQHSPPARQLQQPAAGPGRLPEQDIWLLSLIAEGVTAAQAAEQLGCSVRALRRQLRAICDRLEVNTPIEAVVWAARCQLLMPVATALPTGQASPDPDCAETLTQVYLYLDGEIDAASMAKVREHLEECAHCLREYGLENAVKRLVNKTCGQDPVPEEFRAKVLDSLARLNTQVSTSTSSRGRTSDYVQIGGGWETPACSA